MSKMADNAYTVMAIDYLDAHLPGFSAERSDTKRSISSLLFFNHQKHVVKDRCALAIPGSILTGYIGMTTRTFKRVNAKYGFYDVVEFSKFGICYQYIPTKKTLDLIHGLFSSGEPLNIHRCVKTKNPKFRYKTKRRVYTKLEIEIQGYTIRNYEQDLERDYLDIINYLYCKQGLEKPDNNNPRAVLNRLF